MQGTGVPTLPLVLVYPVVASYKVTLTAHKHAMHTTQLLRHLGIDSPRVYVVGLSIGGALALEMVRHTRDRCFLSTLTHTHTHPLACSTGDTCHRSCQGLGHHQRARIASTQVHSTVPSHHEEHQAAAAPCGWSSHCSHCLSLVHQAPRLLQHCHDCKASMHR